MSNQEIAAVIDRTLDAIRDRLDELDIDEIDTESADGKLVVEFEDGVKLIVSRQSAADQIWLAEPNGGWHYDYREGKWIDDKRGTELIATLSELISGRIQQQVEL